MRWSSLIDRCRCIRWHSELPQVRAVCWSSSTIRYELGRVTQWLFGMRITCASTSYGGCARATPVYEDVGSGVQQLIDEQTDVPAMAWTTEQRRVIIEAPASCRPPSAKRSRWPTSAACRTGDRTKLTDRWAHQDACRLGCTSWPAGGAWLMPAILDERHQGPPDWVRLRSRPGRYCSLGKSRCACCPASWTACITPHWQLIPTLAPAADQLLQLRIHRRAGAIARHHPAADIIRELGGFGEIAARR